MNRYECEKCGNSFSRSDLLLRHTRESCAVRFDSISGVGEPKRRRIDGAASTLTCVVCDLVVPRNQMLIHQRTLLHKSNCCVTVSEGIQLIQSAFKNRIATYHISSDREHLDYTIFFEEVKTKALRLIRDVIEVQKSLKINMVVVGRYILPSNETISDKSFNTTNEIVTIGSDLDEVYQTFVEAMKVQSTEFQEKDSGMSTNQKKIKKKLKYVTF